MMSVVALRKQVAAPSSISARLARIVHLVHQVHLARQALALQPLIVIAVHQAHRRSIVANANMTALAPQARRLNIVKRDVLVNVRAVLALAHAAQASLRVIVTLKAIAIMMIIMSMRRAIACQIRARPVLQARARMNATILANEANPNVPSVDPSNVARVFVMAGKAYPKVANMKVHPRTLRRAMSPDIIRNIKYL
jgi:hypothetical protein